MADANLTPSSQNMLPSVAEVTQFVPEPSSLPSHQRFQYPLHMVTYPHHISFDPFAYHVVHPPPQQPTPSHEHQQPNPVNPEVRSTHYNQPRHLYRHGEPSPHFPSGDYRNMPSLHSDFQSYMSPNPSQPPDLGGPYNHAPLGWSSDPVGPPMRQPQYYSHSRMPPTLPPAPQAPSFPQARRPQMGPFPPVSSVNPSLRGGGGNPISGPGASTPPRRTHERQDMPPIVSTPERHPDVPARRPVSMSAANTRPSEDNSSSLRSSNRRSYANYAHDARTSEMDEESTARFNRRRRHRYQEDTERLFDHRRHYDPNVVTSAQMTNLRQKLRHYSPSELPEGTSPVCDICQKDYATENVEDPSEEEESAIQLPCRHIFGEHCINTWFETCRTHKNKITCPMCRTVLIEPVSRDFLYGHRAFTEALSSMDRHEQRSLVERAMRTYHGTDLDTDF